MRISSRPSHIVRVFFMLQQVLGRRHVHRIVSREPAARRPCHCLARTARGGGSLPSRRAKYRPLPSPSRTLPALRHTTRHRDMIVHRMSDEFYSTATPSTTLSSNDLLIVQPNGLRSRFYTLPPWDSPLSPKNARRSASPISIASALWSKWLHCFFRGAERRAKRR